MSAGQEADLFVLMTLKEELTTRDGKPYFKVAFRDFAREVNFPIWNDSPWCIDCRTQWQPGTFYKLRAIYRETNFGPQLDIRKIRPVCEADAADGFSPLLCQPQTRFDRDAMFAELVRTAEERIDDVALRNLTCSLLLTNRDALLTLPAATHNHHAFVGGWLEHVLSVTRTAVYLADKYDDYYPDMQPPAQSRTGRGRSDSARHRQAARNRRAAARGRIYRGRQPDRPHLAGRDIVREAAAANPLDSELLLRLEHIIVRTSGCPSGDRPSLR